MKCKLLDKSICLETLNMKKISIVIPVYNEEYFISGLLESISRIEYPLDCYEVIVVCDGCTDGTVSEVKKFLFADLIDLKNNVGRYNARKIGAEHATHPNILFIDARCIVDPNILSVINVSTDRVIIGKVLGDKKPGGLETFYAAVRRKVFSNYYKNSSRKIELNKDNFDSLPKGTGVFFVDKDILFRAYDALSHFEMGKDSSDDTKLIKTIVQEIPAILDPDVKIINYYRKSFLAGLSHLAIFIPASFVDYYLHPAQKFFWLVIFFPLLFLLGILLGLIFIPIALLIKIGILLGMDLLIALYFSQSFREFYFILYIMPVCVLSFYFGIIRAIILKAYKLL
jgi:glycosyltransferase involved in cell wall biosynthesis